MQSLVQVCVVVYAGPGSRPPYAVGITSVGVFIEEPVLLLNAVKSAGLVLDQLTIPITVLAPV
jgi:hypothetical protein